MIASTGSPLSLLKYKLVIQVWYIPSNQRAVAQGVKGEDAGGRRSQPSGTAVSCKPLSGADKGMHLVENNCFAVIGNLRFILKANLERALLRSENV